MIFYKEIEIPIFAQVIGVLIGDPEDIKKDTREELALVRDDFDILFDTPYIGGKFLYNPKYNFYLIWLPKIPYSIEEYGYLVHEVQHCTFTLLDNLGFVHSSDSDEMYSYLNSYIFKEVEAKFNKWSEKSSNKEQKRVKNNGKNKHKKL